MQIFFINARSSIRILSPFLLFNIFENNEQFEFLQTNQFWPILFCIHIENYTCMCIFSIINKRSWYRKWTLASLLSFCKVSSHSFPFKLWTNTPSIPLGNRYFLCAFFVWENDLFCGEICQKSVITGKTY